MDQYDRKIFEFVQIEDEEKVKCTVYMLRKDARIRWDVVKKIWDTMTMTWAEFFIEFNFKYYSQVVINIKVAEFTRLQQGNMLVLEYVQQFDQLSRYVPIWFKLKRVRSGDSWADFALV